MTSIDSPLVRETSQLTTVDTNLNLLLLLAGQPSVAGGENAKLASIDAGSGLFTVTFVWKETDPVVAAARIMSVYINGAEMQSGIRVTNEVALNEEYRLSFTSQSAVLDRISLYVVATQGTPFLSGIQVCTSDGSAYPPPPASIPIP